MSHLGKEWLFFLISPKIGTEGDNNNSNIQCNLTGSVVSGKRDVYAVLPLPCEGGTEGDTRCNIRRDCLEGQNGIKSLSTDLLFHPDSSFKMTKRSSS